jgi:hypothetical protein
MKNAILFLLASLSLITPALALADDLPAVNGVSIQSENKCGELVDPTIPCQPSLVLRFMVERGGACHVFAATLVDGVLTITDQLISGCKAPEQFEPTVTLSVAGECDVTNRIQLANPLFIRSLILE